MGKRKGDCYQEISLQSSEFCVFCFVFCVEVAQYRQLATTHTHKANPFQDQLLLSPLNHHYIQQQ